MSSFLREVQRSIQRGYHAVCVIYHKIRQRKRGAANMPNYRQFLSLRRGCSGVQIGLSILWLREQFPDRAPA